MMAAAAAANGVEGFRTGMVLVAQTSGDLLNAHPHLHGLAPRVGGTMRAPGSASPTSTRPSPSASSAPRCSRSSSRGAAAEERERLLLSWEHATGFSVDASVKVEPEDGPGLERLARYLLRRPVSLDRMHWEPGSDEVA